MPSYVARLLISVVVVVLGAGFLERQSANGGDIRMVVGSYLVGGAAVRRPCSRGHRPSLLSLVCASVVSVIAVVVCGSS